MCSLIIACGSYRGEVYALHYNPTSDTANSAILKVLFVDPEAHKSSVSSIAICRDTVMSGGSDDYIQIFSATEKSRLGGLELHTGTIRHLCFASTYNQSSVNSLESHLVSAADDACVAIWRGPALATNQPGNDALTWQCIRQMRRHKAPISGLAIHPTNRIAISISPHPPKDDFGSRDQPVGDGTLRVWNLLRGRQAYAVRLRSLATQASSVTGARDIVGMGDGISLSQSGQRALLCGHDKFGVLELLPASDSAVSNASFTPTYLGTIKCAGSITAQPIFFSEDDFVVDRAVSKFINDGKSQQKWVYTLVGVGDRLLAHRFALPNTSGTSATGKPVQPEVWSSSCADASVRSTVVGAKLPGKRIKALAVVPEWRPPVHNLSTRLTVAMTTDADGSHIRGYAIDLSLGADSWHNCLANPVFTHDATSVRITSMAVGLLRDQLVPTSEQACDSSCADKYWFSAGEMDKMYGIASNAYVTATALATASTLETAKKLADKNNLKDKEAGDEGNEDDDDDEDEALSELSADEDSSADESSDNNFGAGQKNDRQVEKIHPLAKKRRLAKLNSGH